MVGLGGRSLSSDIWSDPLASSEAVGFVSESLTQHTSDLFVLPVWLAMKTG